MIANLDTRAANFSVLEPLDHLTSRAGGIKLVDEYTALCSRPPSVLMTGGALGYLIDFDFAPGTQVGGPYPLTLEGIRIAAEALP